MTEPNEIAKVILDYAKSEGTDIFLFSGPIEYVEAENFVKMVREKEAHAKKATLFLTTDGGDANSAFRMARALQDSYPEGYRHMVAGRCKSAGTLIAIGAVALRFGHFGELGPLDVQMARRDELFLRNSGLDLSNAMEMISDLAFKAFEKYLVDIVSKSRNSVSTRTAAEIATQIATGIYGPIAQQIDPIRIGETQRALFIAMAYGKRLGNKHLKPGALDRLVGQYPCHEFVIDRREAEGLFSDVGMFTDQEKQIASFFWLALRAEGDKSHILDLVAISEKEQENGPRAEETDPAPPPDGVHPQAGDDRPPDQGNDGPARPENEGERSGEEGGERVQ